MQLQYGYDLFNDVVVTREEILIYLNTHPNFRNTSRTPRAIEQYIKEYDLANKIKSLKLNGSFIKLIEEIESDKKYEEIKTKNLQIYSTKYKEIWTRKPCPTTFHICAWMDCPTFERYKKQMRQRQYYSARKLKLAA